MQVFETSRCLRNEVENQTEYNQGSSIRSEVAQYLSQEVERYLKACGIVQQLTPPYTPQHNGVSERRNCTLLDMVRSMMNLTTFVVIFWDYALRDWLHAFLQYGSTRRVIRHRYELFGIGKVPNLFIIGFRSEALMKRDTPDKLHQRSVKYVSYLKKNLITQEVSGRAIDLEETQDEDTSPSKITSEISMEVEGFEPPQEEVILIRSKGLYSLYGVDYEETFSPVADIRVIRILISITAFYDYEIWKIDVKTSFLNGYLDEDIYMVQPEGFVDPKHPRKASGSNVTFLILYVDDIIIMGNHIPSLQSVKDYLGKCFAMKDLREATFILGIKIYRDRSKRLIGLGQNAYMDKILKRYKMDNSKRGHIPMQESFDLNKTQGASTPE
ncbi:retrotransposon protein, putative, ty1-copia subclass [Tanacetum coccineum]